MKANTESRLDREQLVAAAFAQLEEDGLNGLSMRRVAARLGVQAPALYWHVKDKTELLGLMAFEIFRTAHSRTRMAPDWRAWLKQYGHALRSSLTSHRDGALLCVASSPYRLSDSTQFGDQRVAALMQLGLDRERATLFQASVVSLVFGWTIRETDGPLHDFLGRLIDSEAGFVVSLQALLDGFVGPGPDAERVHPD